MRVPDFFLIDSVIDQEKFKILAFKRKVLISNVSNSNSSVIEFIIFKKKIKERVRIITAPEIDVA